MAKFVKRDYFNTIGTIVSTADLTGILPEGMTAADLSDFIQKQIDQLANRSGSSRKPTANQKANEGFKTEILSVLNGSDNLMRIADIQAANMNLTNLSNQKVNRLLIALRDAGLVGRTYIKKVAYFYSIGGNADPDN